MTLLWTAEFKGGGAVVIILEAQSTPDLRMPARMMTLTGLVCEGLTDAAKGPDGRMPAVLPMVLYTGLRRWTPALDLAGAGGTAFGAVGPHRRTALRSAVPAQKHFGTSSPGLRPMK